MPGTLARLGTAWDTCRDVGRVRRGMRLAVDAALGGSKLRPMLRFRVSGRGVSAAALVVLAAAACERTTRTVPVDTSRVASRPDTTTRAPAPQSAWDRTRFGSVLLISGDDPATALAVFPDSGRDTSLAGESATLVGRDGETQTARVQARVELHGDACGGYTAWHVSSIGSVTPWAFALIGAQVRPIKLDSLSGLTHADSARLVAQATRLASVLPTGGGEDRFQGLPFAVRALWRFPVAGGEVMVAGLMRQINQEAQPLEERTMIIAERDSAARDWRTSYYERSRGADETVEAREVVAAAYIGSSAEPLLVVARDYSDAAAYSLIERTANGWRLVWTSPRVRC